MRKDDDIAESTAQTWGKPWGCGSKAADLMVGDPP
jgi:hypothetical protein